MARSYRNIQSFEGMKIKITLTFYLKPARLSKMNKRNDSLSCQRCDGGKHLFIAIRSANSYSHYGKHFIGS